MLGRCWGCLHGPSAISSAVARRGDDLRRLSVTSCVINGVRYGTLVLQSFGSKDTERVWERRRSKQLDPATQRVAWRKLAILDAAETLDDLRVPPGSRLEKLKGDRAGQHSIRINRQWRICFVWTPVGPTEVEVTDYH